MRKMMEKGKMATKRERKCANFERRTKFKKLRGGRGDKMVKCILVSSFAFVFCVCLMCVCLLCCLLITQLLWNDESALNIFGKFEVIFGGGNEGFSVETQIAKGSEQVLHGFGIC